MIRTYKKGIERSSRGFSIPDGLRQQVELLKLSMLAARLYIFVWQRIQAGAIHGFYYEWVSQREISVSSRVPIEDLESAQQECIAAKLLVIGPAQSLSHDKQRYSLGSRAIRDDYSRTVDSLNNTTSVLKIVYVPPAKESSSQWN